MEIQSYKCPNCGGGLVFDPKTQKFKCEYCLSAFTEETLKEMEEAARKSEEASKPGGMPEAEKIESQKQAESKMVLYTCPSCGAEVVTDATTAATFCYYCHNPVVLSGKLSGEFLPDYVIPFAMDKKKATGIFLDWIKKKKYIPDDFFSKDQIEKFSGVYFPYLMYSCRVDGRIQAEGEKNRTWVTGNIRYTEHKKYRMERAGQLDVKNVTRNALKKNNSALVEGVLPFDMEKLQPFDMGYLSGFQAEKRDMEKESLTGMAMENYQKLIEYILEKTDMGVALIPHVVWDFSDDRIPLRELYRKYQRTGRVVMIEDHNCMKLKGIISRCRFFIGARTHATIAAYSTGVPTLVVGYSVKARGIARDLFGTEEGYVLPVQRLKESNELTRAFINLYEKRESIRTHLKTILPAYIARADGARRALEELIKK